MMHCPSVYGDNCLIKQIRCFRIGRCVSCYNYGKSLSQSEKSLKVTNIYFNTFGMLYADHQ